VHCIPRFRRRLSRAVHQRFVPNQFLQRQILRNRARKGLRLFRELFAPSRTPKQSSLRVLRRTRRQSLAKWMSLLPWPVE
jgi:hypothetical protein